MSGDYAEFRSQVIKYFRWNVYNQGTEILEWIPRNKARILNLMMEEFKDHPVSEIELVLDQYYSKM